MATARVYRDSAGLIAFLPAVLEEGTFYLVDDPEQLGDTVIGELRLLQRHWRGSGQPLLVIRWRPGRSRRDPDAILRLGHALASGCLEGGAGAAGSARSAQRLGLLGGPTGQAIGSSAASIAATPMLPSSSHHPLTIEQEAGARRDPDRRPGGAALGKHLLERAGGAARTAGATPRSERDPAGTIAGRTGAVAGPGGGDLPPQPGRIRLVGGAPAAPA